MTMTVSKGARFIMDKIGNDGMILAIEKNGSNPRLIAGHHGDSKDTMSLNVDDVRELLESGNLRKLTADGEDFGGGNRLLGWREINLPGDYYDLYCLVQ